MIATVQKPIVDVKLTAGSEETVTLRGWDWCSGVARFDMVNGQCLLDCAESDRSILRSFRPQGRRYNRAK